MNTKVEGLQGTPVRTTVTAPAAPSVGGSAKSGPVSAVDDSVRLSGDAVDLAGLTKQLSGGPSIDAAKVNSLRAALESGSYKIDAQEIARRLTRLERELGL